MFLLAGQGAAAGCLALVDDVGVCFVSGQCRQRVVCYLQLLSVNFLDEHVVLVVMFVFYVLVVYLIPPNCFILCVFFRTHARTLIPHYG